MSEGDDDENRDGPLAPELAVDLADALALVRRLGALPEPAMRAAVLIESLAATSPADAVRLIATVAHEAHRRPGPPWQAGLFALAGALSTPGGVPYVLAASWYEAAKEAGEEAVARMFLGGRRAPDDPPPEPEQPLLRGGRAYTLGERKQMARGPRSDLLTRLGQDPDPQVIRILLENPHLTERDVVAIAARRPVRGEVPAVVALSPWIKRPMVRRAIVLNPNTPTEVSLRLLPLLATRDLKEVAGDSHLPTIVRAQARDLLAPRRGG